MHLQSMQIGKRNNSKKLNKIPLGTLYFTVTKSSAKTYTNNYQKIIYMAGDNFVANKWIICVIFCCYFEWINIVDIVDSAAIAVVLLVKYYI